MPRTDDEVVRDFYRAIEFDRSLDRDDHYRVDIYSHRDLTPTDPIARLRRAIEFSSGRGAYLFSGFRGSGKTTELRRLTGDLEDRGWTVIRTDVRDYLNLDASLDMTSFMLAIVGAFSDALEARELIGRNVAKPGYWQQFAHFAKTPTSPCRRSGSGPPGSS